MRFKLYKLGQMSAVVTEKGGSCACLHGKPYMDSSGNCHCEPIANGKTYKPTRTPAQIDYANPRVIEQTIQQALANAQLANAGTVTTGTATTANSFNASEFFQNNKLLVLAGVAAVGFFAFSSMGGGKFAGKTRTEVTRWGGGS